MSTSIPSHNNTVNSEHFIDTKCYVQYTHTYKTTQEYYRISWPIRRTVIISLDILEKNNDECILILVIYWKKTGLLHTKISNHNIIYSS